MICIIGFIQQELTVLIIKLVMTIISKKNQHLMISLLNLLSLLYYSMQTKFYETRPSEANDAAFNDSFIFHFLAIFSFLHSPRPTFLSSLLPRPLK